MPMDHFNPEHGLRYAGRPTRLRATNVDVATKHDAHSERTSGSAHQGCQSAAGRTTSSRSDRPQPGMQCSRGLAWQVSRVAVSALGNYTCPLRGLWSFALMCIAQHESQGPSGS